MLISTCNCTNTNTTIDISTRKCKVTNSNRACCHCIPSICIQRIRSCTNPNRNSWTRDLCSITICCTKGVLRTSTSSHSNMVPNNSVPSHTVLPCTISITKCSKIIADHNRIIIRSCFMITNNNYIFRYCTTFSLCCNRWNIIICNRNSCCTRCRNFNRCKCCRCC